MAKGYTVTSADMIGACVWCLTLRSSRLLRRLVLTIVFCLSTAGYPTNQPVVFGVSGCDQQNANKTAGCPTAGGVRAWAFPCVVRLSSSSRLIAGVWLTVRGKNFIPPVSATINGQSCSPMRNVGTTKFE